MALPDGGLLIAKKSHGYQEPGAYVTYEQMRTISYCVAGPYGVSNAFRIGNGRIVVFATGNGGFTENTAILYRWVPNKCRNLSQSEKCYLDLNQAKIQKKRKST